MFEVIQIPLSKIRSNSFYGFSDCTVSSSVDFQYIPPIIVIPDCEDYIIFDGYQRYLAFETQSIQEIPSILLDSDLSDPLDRLFLYLDLNQITHEIHDFYKSKVLNFISYKKLSLENQEKLFQKLNIKNNYEAQILYQINFFPQKIKDYYLKQKYNFKWLKLWLSIKSESLEDIFDELKDYSFNQNIWIEVLQNLIEISKRDEVSILNLIKRIKTNHSDIFRSKLKELKFPRLYKKEKEFLDYIHQLKIDPKIKLSSERFFEKESLDLNIKVQSPEDIEKITKELKEINWKEIFKFIS